MRPPLPVAVTVVLAAFAGCLGDSSPPATNDQLPEIPNVPDPRTLIHALGAKALNASLYPGELPVVEQRYVATRESGEPTIGVTSTGAAFYPSIEFDALQGMLPRTEIYRSRDNGSTWDEVTPALGGQDLPPVSLDPYIYVDPRSDRLFTIDLYVGCSWLHWSDDEGDTWSTNPITCGVPVNDHQTLFGGAPATLPTLNYPSALYFCVNQVADSLCTHSLDGGLTWTGLVPAFLGAEADAENPTTPSFCGGLHGHGHASGADGTAYLPRGYCGEAWVAVSHDGGVTWEQVLVDASVGVNGHEAIVSTDTAGNAYYFFLDRFTFPRLSISRDQGRTWSTPLNLTVPGPTAAKFPSIVAGDEGRIAFLYVGSNVTDGFQAEDEAQENATWNAYVGFSLNILDTEPVLVTTTANPLDDPLRRGECFGRCHGMYDFFDIDIHPTTGQVWVALVDVCNDACATPNGTFEDPVTSRGAVGVQLGGSLLKGPLEAKD